MAFGSDDSLESYKDDLSSSSSIPIILGVRLEHDDHDDVDD